MKALSIKGISIVEIIVASAIIAISVSGIVASIQVYLKVVHQNTRETQAVLLLDETAEALQYMRDDSFETHYGSINFGDQYTIFWNASGYELSTSTVELPYQMTRTVTFAQVKRDGGDRIDPVGTVDDRTLKATLIVAWPYKDETKTITSEMLIHNIYEN